ncbi:MAG: T9SS type A sorting domain-containing protein [Bacteroidota bacterium]|nr:T9SS type A sorting domain-containing protein [Bacteroidota bacterium]
MKTKLLIVLCIVLYFRAYPQAYYPLEIGNLWQYWDCYDTLVPGYPYTVHVVGETTMANGYTYSIFEERGQRGYGLCQIGSKVYAYYAWYPPEDIFLLYDFSKTTGDTVGINYYPGDTMLVTVVYDGFGYVFGKWRRKWRFYEQSLKSSLYALREVTDSIGLTFQIFEPGVIVECLRGAIINGIRYGVITNVKLTNDYYPEKYELYQNYPNPFNPLTTIEYQLMKRSHVYLVVYDVLGREIETLVNQIQNSGIQSIIWNPRNLSGGVYFYRLTIDGKIISKKMVLLR